MSHSTAFPDAQWFITIVRDGQLLDDGQNVLTLIGPFDTEAEAVTYMNDSSFVDAECMDNCIDCQVEKIQIILDPPKEED